MTCQLPQGWARAEFFLADFLCARRELRGTAKDSRHTRIEELQKHAADPQHSIRIYTNKCLFYLFFLPFY